MSLEKSSASHATRRCPHCQAEIPALPSGDADCAAHRKRFQKWAVLGAAVAFLGLGLFLGYRYRGQFTTVLLLANELTGDTRLSLAGLFLLLAGSACVAAWMLLPFLLAWVYLDLRRRFPAPRSVWNGDHGERSSRSGSD